MRPRIGIILSPNGVDCVTILPGDSETRRAGYEFCSLLEEELQAFETAILKKTQSAKWKIRGERENGIEQ